MKNNLTNPLLDVKKIVLNEVISPTSAPTANINDAFVMLPLVTERKTKFISNNSRQFTYLLMYLLIFFSPLRIFPIKKSRFTFDLNPKLLTGGPLSDSLTLRCKLSYF